MTDTKGNGVLNTEFYGYGDYKGDIAYRKQGSLIAYESGETVTYGLFNAQERGTLFVGPGEKVYGALRLSPKKELSLEEAIEFIDTDELLEITPENLRIRKKILDGTARYRAGRNNKNS